MSEATYSNSPYHFANNNPISFSDPTGLISKPTSDHSITSTFISLNAGGFSDNFGNYASNEGGEFGGFSSMNGFFQDPNGVPLDEVFVTNNFRNSDWLLNPKDQYYPYSQFYSYISADRGTRRSLGVYSPDFLSTGLGIFDVGAGVYNEGYNHTTYTTTKGVTKNIYKVNGQVRSAQAAKFAKISNVVRGVAVIGSVLTTGYSTYLVVDQIKTGGMQNIKGWDATDAGVGVIGLGATGLAYFGIISNPVGWVVGAGVLIYSGSRLVYDLNNNY